jgi:hypothetical protein
MGGCDVMTNEQKLLAAQLLPVLADFLEDVPMQHLAKMKRNRLVTEIRSFDSFLMVGADLEAMEQQIALQQAFRQWLTTHLLH